MTKPNDALVEKVAREVWTNMLRSGQANDLREWDARSGKDGAWEWQSPALDDKAKARIRSAARAAISAIIPEGYQAVIETGSRLLEWWPVGSGNSLAGKNKGDGFAADLEAFRSALAASTQPGEPT